MTVRVGESRRRCGAGLNALCSSAGAKALRRTSVELLLHHCSGKFYELLA